MLLATLILQNQADKENWGIYSYTRGIILKSLNKYEDAQKCFKVNENDGVSVSSQEVMDIQNEIAW